MKAVNFDELGNFSETSESVKVRTAAEATGATLFVAAQDSSIRGRAGADFVCDGEDDQVEINEAIDEIKEKGGKVVLLEGTYVVQGIIECSSNIIIEGQGGSTILKMKDRDSVIKEFPLFFAFVNTVENFIVRDFCVEGNKENTSSGMTFARVNDEDKKINFEMENLIIKNINGDAVEFRKGVERVKIKKCIFVNCGKLSISNNTTISESSILNSSDDSINIESESNDIKITDNEIINSGFRGIRITGQADNLKIKENTIAGSQREAVAFGSWGGGNGLVVDNIIKGNNVSGDSTTVAQISIESVKELFISENIIRLANGGSEHGISVLWESEESDIVISNNELKNSGSNSAIRDDAEAFGESQVDYGAGNRLNDGNWDTGQDYSP